MLFVIASDLRIRIGIWAVRTSHITRVYYRQDNHERELFGPWSEPIGTPPLSTGLVKLPMMFQRSPFLFQIFQAGHQALV